ncbi:MAG TPA: hypothetical protein VHK70_08495 [Burkholderiaceae bacterium]|jgi:hypothetical protein|nr:hypothetical protein [Burkholderiaceae bacterium]
MRISLGIAGLAVLLVACAAPEQRIALEERPVETLAPYYGAACSKLGYTQGSEQWRNCILRSDREKQLEQYGLFYDSYMQWYRLR